MVKCPKCGHEIPDFDDEEEEPMRADQGGHTLPLSIAIDNTSGAHLVN